jgi:hypothetical protein
MARERRAWEQSQPLLLARPDDPAEALLSLERQSALVRGLARLSPEHRQVVTCRYLLDLDEAGTGAAPPPPKVAQDWSVSEAAAAVDFTLSVPEELGDPAGVEVSPDRRLVSMSWATDEDGGVRLDQFDARYDFSVLKRAPGVFYAAVGGTNALWFEKPHEVVLLEPDGSRPGWAHADLAGRRHDPATRR